MRPTYARRRRPPAHREAATFKKDNQQEPSFFGDALHESFFKPAVVMPQANIQRKCAACEKEEKVQRMAGAKEEEKVQRAPEKKEEEKVHRMPEKPSAEPTARNEEEKVQRMAGPKAEEKVQRAPEKKEEEKLQKKESVTAAPAPTLTVGNYIGSINGKGQPMDKQTRSFYESRIGADFSDVKIHTGQEAAQSAKGINAQAYAYGNHIVFNEGKYQPETSEGQHLLAHELAHVVQQGGKKTGKAFRRPFPPGEDPVHSGITDDYRQLRGLPTGGRDPQGGAVGPTDWEITHRLAPVIARLVQELRTAYATGGITALFARMRTLTPVERTEPELAAFVAVTLAGNELWAANNLLSYGPETAWPLPLRVRRELLPLPGSGGVAQVQTLLGTASDSIKRSIINDATTMTLIRALSATDRQAIGAALINLSAIPAGNAQAATAELLLSANVLDQNTALRLANGDIRVYYMESLTRAANEASILAANGLSATQFAIYNYPDGTAQTMSVQLNAQGFRINGTNIICGQQALTVERWRTLLVHETNHARNVSPTTPLQNYQSEFRAYWVSEFSGVADLNERARQIKAHILRDYPLISNAYNNDATVRAAIDAHTRPDGNITNE